MGEDIETLLKRLLFKVYVFWQGQFCSHKPENCECHTYANVSKKMSSWRMFYSVKKREFSHNWPLSLTCCVFHQPTRITDLKYCCRNYWQLLQNCKFVNNSAPVWFLDLPPFPCKLLCAKRLYTIVCSFLHGHSQLR